MGAEAFGKAVAHQVLVNIAAALVAAWIIGRDPQLRAWINAQTRGQD